MIKVAVAFAFLALNFYVYHYFASEEVHPPRTAFSAFPLELGEWRCGESVEMEEKVEANLGVTDYLLCEYRREDPRARVSLYVGYHASQVRKEGGGAGENSIHPPKHCLPGSGWNIIAHELVPLEVPGLPEPGAPVNRLVIAKGEKRQLVYYWYQSRGRVVAEDWKKIVLMSWDRARLNRTDGSLVRFTAPVRREDLERADGHVLDLASRVLPRLSEFVPES
ncbi:MAG: EpsI family protein [Myxococcota bacterium]|nr:EpsI family protein [Myxococcota bacterium]